MIALMMIGLPANAGLGKFDLFYSDGYTDQYDSAQARFTRKSCRGPDYSVSFLLDRQAVKRLEVTASRIDFFRLPDWINTNSVISESGVAEVISCGPCARSTLKISKGRKSHQVEWSCNCEIDGKDPAEIEPLVRELRQILYGNPAIAGLPKSSCVFY